MDKYPIGSVIKGQIRNVPDLGVCVGVEEGVDGLVHVSDISWTQRIKHPGEMFKKGDEVEAVVLNIDVENERFSLGIKQLQPDPWDTLSERTPVGSRVKGKVTKVTDFGAFVEIEPGIEGLVHVSELKEERVENPRDVVEAMVLSIDAENQRLSLGLKQLATDIWEDFFSRHKAGDNIEGKVVRMTNFGAFVELDEGIEGLIHVSEFDDSQGGEKIDLEVEKSYQMKIIKLSPAERKIGLSIRALKSAEFRTDWESYATSQGDGGATLGDHLKHK